MTHSMTFKAEETSDDIRRLHCLDEDQASLSHSSSETSVDVETSVTIRHLLSKNSKHCQDVFSEDNEIENVAGYDSRLASACVDENSVPVRGEISELPVRSGESAIRSQAIFSENRARLSDVMDRADGAESRMESCNGKIVLRLQGVTETESVVDVISEHACASCEACVEFNDGADVRGDGDDECRNHQSDNNGNSKLLTGASVFPSDVSSVGYDSCLADVTSPDTVPDEYYSVQFNSDVERTESIGTENPPGLDADDPRHTKHRTVSPAKSFMDRKSRPVPLPRSNTFRVKSTSEITPTRSSRSSIPVQYETCSSVQSKICQTMALGTECESAYTLPPGINFSDIYVDHRMVDEWTGESDYDLLRASTFADDDDDYSRRTYCEPDVILGRGLSTHESDYDVLRDDIWEGAYDGLPDCETETENDAVAGVPSASNESDSRCADAWSDARDVASFQSAAKPSLPVDVCVEEVVSLVVVDKLLMIIIMIVVMILSPNYIV